MSRALIIQILSLSAVIVLVTMTSGAPDETGDQDGELLFEFGAIADCQYCDADGKQRRYRLSPGKLRKCIDDFNKRELSHVVHLGDFIDRDWKSYDDVLPIMRESKAPVRFVLGNHDFSVADEFKDKVPERLGLSSRYYDFAVRKWRFLVLDSNDVSLYAYPAGSEKAKESREIYEALGGDLPDYNGAIGAEQLEWIERQLIDAAARGETVVLYAHHPVYPISRGHNLWNDQEVIDLLEKHACVAAFINGHNHAGAYGVRNGIHYLTLKGMVDTEENSYCVMRVYADRIEVRGRGRQEDFELELSRSAGSR